MRLRDDKVPVIIPSKYYWSDEEPDKVTKEQSEENSKNKKSL